jgi:hypothetical protein
VPVHLKEKEVSNCPRQGNCTHVAKTVVLTRDEVGGQDQNVLYNIRALERQLQHAFSIRTAGEERRVPLHIGLDGLLALFPSDLVNGFDFAQMVVGDVPSPHGAFPGDGPGADVVLERAEVGGRLERHGVDRPGGAETERSLGADRLRSSCGGWFQ